MKYIQILAAAAAIVVAGQACAGQLNYTPKNPTFGGNPNYGSFLLSTAQTQGDGVKSGQSSSPDLSGLEDALGNLGNVTGSTGTTGTSPIIIIGNGTTPTNP